VLIVDDERDAASTLAELMRGAGHEVEIAHDGRHAIAAIPEFAPDVVLVALELPDTNGYALAHDLRARFGQTLRIVALTGYQRDTQRLAAAGFDDHVIKPPSHERLAAALVGTSRL
jgi:CheY-like chemotaxis protein